MSEAREKRRKPDWVNGIKQNKWQLVVYDFIVFIAVCLLLLVFYTSGKPLPARAVIAQTAIAFISVFGCRLIGGIYRQIWRYGGIQCYIRLLLVDTLAFCIFFAS